MADDDICILRSCDACDFRLSVKDAKKLSIIQELIEEVGIDKPLYVEGDIQGNALSKVVEYITQGHVFDRETAEMTDWEESFMLSCQDILPAVLTAAQYLDNKDLYHLIGKKIASDLAYNCLGEEESAEYLGLKILPTQEECDALYEKYPSILK